MAYTKQTWDTNSYINPTRMNYMEQGIYDASVKADTIGNTSDLPSPSRSVAQNISDINNNLTNISSMVNAFKSSPIKATGANTSVSFTINDLTNGTPSGAIFGLCDFNGHCVAFAIPIHARTVMVNNIAQMRDAGASGISATISGNVLTITATTYSYIQLLSPWNIS